MRRIGRSGNRGSDRCKLREWRYCRDKTADINTGWGTLLMATTTNIGPCACCGGTSCSCTLTNCLWKWVDGAWTIIDYCGGGDGSSKPCCDCPNPPRDGIEEDEEYPIACTGANSCSCTQCSGWWDEFLVEWVPQTGCLDQYGALKSACVCDLSGLAPGTVHHEDSGPQPCTC